MNKKIGYYIFIILSFLLTSCSQLNKNEESFDSVSFDVGESSKRPSLNPESNLGKYGPSKNSKEKKYKKDDTKLLGVLITPGFYRTLSGLQTLECLERYGRKVSVVSGVGFGSIVAALYVQERSVEKVKWLFYKEMRKVRDLEPFGTKWLEQWKEFIDRNISVLKIKTSPISLWLPTYSKERNEVKYSSKGNIKDKLYQSINLRNQSFILKTNFINNENIKKLPVDKLFISLSVEEEIISKKRILLNIYKKVNSVMRNLEHRDNLSFINIENSSSLESSKLWETLTKKFCKEVSGSLK